MYQAEISRDHPALILFLFDCSYSMSETYGSTNMSRGAFLAGLCNKTIDQVILACEKGTRIRAYFELGILGYGDGAEILKPVQSIIDLAHNPLKMEQGDIDGVPIEKPVWLEDPTQRANTDMKAGFSLAYDVLNRWAKAHPASFPPVLLHVSDGEWTTGKPISTARKIQVNVRTDDGACIIMNIHIGDNLSEVIIFPSLEPVGDKHRKALFQMSAVLPDSFLQRARETYSHVPDDARGYMFNAQPDDLSKFFDIGTRLIG